MNMYVMIFLQSEDSELLDNFVPTERVSKDEHKLNFHGGQLLELCKNTGIIIFNGRTCEDSKLGEFTTTNNSVVDYVMGSPKVFEHVIKFEVLPFDGTCSDIHCSMSCSLSIDVDGRKGSTTSFKESHDGKCKDTNPKVY